MALIFQSRLQIAFVANSTEIIGIAAGICTSTSLLPQLVKLIKRKKAEDISFFYLGVLLIGLALWIWYGFKREDTPIILTNCFALLLNIVVIVVSIRYKHGGKNDN